MVVAVGSRINWSIRLDLRNEVIKLWEQNFKYREIAVKMSLTETQIKGEVKHLQEKGILGHRGAPRKSPQSAPQSAPQQRSLREIVAIRAERVKKSGGRFEDLTREQRGMPPADIAQEQHPDHAPGVNRDAAHRKEHGRTHIYTIEDVARLKVSRRFLDIVSAIRKCPSQSEYETLNDKEKGLIRLGLRQTLSEFKECIIFLETLPEAVPIDPTFTIEAVLAIHADAAAADTM